MAGRERVSKQRVSRVRESVREFRRGHGGVLQGHRARCAERRGARASVPQRRVRGAARRRGGGRGRHPRARSRRRRRLGESKTRAARRAMPPPPRPPRGAPRRSRRSSTVGRRLGARSGFWRDSSWSGDGNRARRIASPRTSPSRAPPPRSRGARRSRTRRRFRHGVARCWRRRTRVCRPPWTSRRRSTRRGAASGRRAAAFLDVAECVSSSFAATAAMRDLASELARRAREDAVDARDGRVAAVEKTVARFCAAASEAGQTLGV